MSVKLKGKLGSFLRIETKGLERLQAVRALNDSTYSQKGGVEANFASGCSSPQLLTKHAVLSIGSFQLAPGFGIFAILNFHKMVGSELTGVPDPGRRKVCWR